MIWPWRRKNTPKGRKVTPIPADATSLDEAKAARQLSERGKQEAVDREADVRQVARSLKQHRRENHFVELMYDTFKEHRT